MLSSEVVKFADDSKQFRMEKCQAGDKEFKELSEEGEWATECNLFNEVNVKWYI